MDLVLGLSISSAVLRWVLVEGTTAEGATISRDAVDSDTLDDVLTAVADNRLHAVGVTWATEAEAAASSLLDALADRGLYNVVTVSDEEAADALAAGIADRGGFADVAVCLFEPDGALLTVVDADGVTTDRVEPTADEIFAALDRHAARPESIFVLGSAGDLDAIAASFDGAGVPVITAAQADLALARGAALASAGAVNALNAPPARWRMPSRTAALSSVVAAAAVALVVSLSTLLGIGLTPDRETAVAQRDTAATIEKPVRPPAKPPAAPSAQAAPAPVPPQPVPAAALPPPPEPEAHPIVEAAAPLPDVPDAIPMVEPPAAPAPEPAAVPPAPNYVPPAPAPVYVPPAPPPQPRLRDRIIERIPIINRFHEPQYGYGN
ncbi:hypothetical protein A5724_27700 [Mycobacterium sp. ACS1612]|uniref:DUF7159 family protein n=1 Tax=Mycobacterium sp. ACS1612 TaxID=1834117 RepID=UPI0007FD9BAA|nr:hypothetical protein [Mycobacterium sp. ACS1612]OBF28213.1 hypothetical protein A5724_27700 [Mycobacterium sp. ACS1612]